MAKRNRSQSISKTMRTKKLKMDLAESEDNAKDVKFNEVYNDLLMEDEKDSLTELLKIGLEIEKNLSQAEYVEGKIDHKEPNKDIAVPVHSHTSSSDLSHDSSGSSDSSDDSSSSSDSSDDSSSSSDSSDDSSSSSDPSDDSSSSSGSSSTSDLSCDNSMEEMGAKLALLLENEEKTTKATVSSCIPMRQQLNLVREVSPSPQRQVAPASVLTRSLFSPISSFSNNEEKKPPTGKVSSCIPTRQDLNLVREVSPPPQRKVAPVSVRTRSLFSPSSSSSDNDEEEKNTTGKVSPCIPSMQDLNLVREVFPPPQRKVAPASLRTGSLFSPISCFSDNEEEKPTTGKVSSCIPTRQDLNLVREVFPPPQRKVLFSPISSFSDNEEEKVFSCIPTRQDLNLVREVSPPPQRKVAPASVCTGSLFSPISSFSDSEEEKLTTGKVSSCIPTRQDLNLVREVAPASVRTRSLFSSISSSREDEEKPTTLITTASKATLCIPTRQVATISVRSHSRSGSSSSHNFEKEKTLTLKATASKVSSYVPTRQDLNLVRLSRHDLERFIRLPFFDRVATGCYVRVGIRDFNNVSVYAVAEVIGLYETRIYNLGNTKTNKGLKVRQGNQERELYYRMEFVSNQDFSDQEYHTWMRSTTGKGLLSKTQIDQKQADIKEAMNYKFKDQGPKTVVKENKWFKSKRLNYAMKKKEAELAMSRGGGRTVRERILQENKWFEANPLNAVRNRRIEAMTIGDWKTARNLELPDFKKRSKHRNDGNGQKNIEKASNGIMVAGPTSRITTRPRMSFKARDTTAPLALKSPDVSTRLEPAKTISQPNHVKQDVLPRKLSLEDYKTKRGLM